MPTIIIDLKCNVSLPHNNRFIEFDQNGYNLSISAQTRNADLRPVANKWQIIA